ncbi:putative MFS monocarboxylate transporter [Aspergillus clavatus NRRL 1]|uniref:MFS monocarboxylate transporter, putative n=1 Tax=Aspergillus clavatus (strain ATCC 1007 / CBS 513.65 / DSM 816 / NCTC 3887 / NRRL 1 / QM 1276 / 107) TaxID=344612 RepID=A1CCK3_ASPCL|nr:MFS monocarboxylate transporter, putative [Aspergillus clavatus NRRL 1]EAW12260.1 MFS monocarboxylate transporter, putative [Aspergillus clavatus NRRL 1]
MEAEQSEAMTDSKPPSEYTFVLLEPSHRSIILAFKLTHVASSRPRANLTILGSFMGAFCTVGFLNSFGVFQEYYARNQLADKSESTIAWLGALSIFFVFSVSMISGQLLDMLGPKLLLYMGSLGTVFSLMMTSLCKEFYQFILAQGILLGISLALLVCPMLALVGQYIKVKRGAAMGIVIAGSSLGGVVWPIIINELLKKPNIRFEWTMRIVGFIMMPLLTISCVCCRPPKSQQHLIQPPSSLQDNESAVPQHESKDTPKADFSILREPVMQVSCLAFFIIYFGMFSPFFFTTSYAVSQGFSTDLAFYTISIINGASFFGRIIPGILADRYGRFNCCVLATLVSGIIALCWTSATSVAGLVIWSAAYGFTSGAILALQQACAAQIATPKTLGLAIGAVMASTSLSAMAGVPISGELASKYGYLSLSIYSGVSLLVGGLLLAVARFMQNSSLRASV